MEVRVGDLMTCLNAILLSSAAAPSLFTVRTTVAVLCPQKKYIFYIVIGANSEKNTHT